MDVIQGVKPKRVLEIGTLIGYSTILIAKDLAGNAQLISIEIHEDEAKTARENIKRAEVSSTIDVIVGDALQIIPKLTGSFDLVFVDAEKPSISTTCAWLRTGSTREALLLPTTRVPSLIR